VDAQLLTEAIAYYQTASKAFKTGALKAPFYVKPTAASAAASAAPAALKDAPQ
jgi:hypothetical protein